MIADSGWLRAQNGALILRVAAVDVDEVERVLGPQLPRRLCVVSSRSTARQVVEVQATLRARADEWLVESWGHGMDAMCQPFNEVQVLRVTPELAEWAATLPDGLLTVDAGIVPV